MKTSVRFAVLVLLVVASFTAAQMSVNPETGLLDIKGPTAFDKASWGLCTTADCAVATNITVPYIVVQGSTFNTCWLAAKTAPVGASLIIDIKRNGTTIFGGGTKLVIAAGATTGTQATFASPTNAVADQLTVDITQIGSGTPGRDVSIACKLTL